MKDLFIPYDLALIAKQKGFDTPCLAKWLIYVKGDTVPHFNYNSDGDGMWFNHNGKDVSDLNGNNGKEFLWSAPMYQQVVDWFRIQHNIHIQDNWNHLLNDYFISIKTMNGELLLKENRFKTYEECRIKAIEEALKLI